MRKVALRGLAQRKLRAFVTTLAVLLGVAFIAGSYVLTDTINESFDDIFTEAYSGTDVAVSPSTTGQGEEIDLPPFPAEVLNQVREVDGVEQAAGGIFSTIRFVDAEGDPLSHGFAPEFVSSVAPEPFETLTYTDGRPPENASEASIDESTADREDFAIGDTLRIAGPAGVKGYEIVGLQRLGSTSSGGSSTAQLTLEEAQRLTDKQGEFDGISVEAADGVAPGELARRIDGVLPARLTVETGTQAAERQSQDIKEYLSFFRIVLLVFGGVALLVGSFLIFNTFSITVAQRIRELGMLRTLGATRGQILRGMVLAARTIVLSLVVGMVVTLAAALSPALRATRVSPMAALLEAALPESRSHGRVFTAFAMLLMIGLAVVVFVTVFAAGISASIGDAIDRNFQGDVVLQNVDGFSPISPEAGREAAQVDGVKTVSSLSFSGGEYEGKDIRVSAVDPTTVSDVLSLEWEEGSPDTLTGLTGDTAVLDDAWASSNDVDVGDQVTVLTPLEREVTLTVDGTVKDNADLLGNVVVSEDTLRREVGTRQPSMTLVAIDQGAHAERVQEQISDRVDRRFPTVDALNQQELKDNQEE